MTSSTDEVCKDDMSENNDADSNSSDATAAENKNRQLKKKSLNDMLKKLNPEGDDAAKLQELPAFLQKNSSQMSLEMTCNNDPDPMHSQAAAPLAESKSPVEQKPTTNASTPAPHAKVSSPKTSAEVYKCHVDNCFAAFSQVSDFKQHIHTLHSEVTSIPCCFCYSTYTFDNIFDHLALHIKNVMKCIYCQVSQDTREELLKHLSEKHPNQPKKINVCIRILNNVRSKRSNSEQSQESKTSEKPQQNSAPESAPVSAKPTPSASKPEVPKSRNPRKSAKPVKTQVAPVSDEVHINSPEEELPINCDQCTFTCNSESVLRQHVQEGHVSPASASFFRCKQCKLATDCKDAFQTHVAHHKGTQTIRYYLCPYCPVSSNSMDVVEDHVGEKHPTEAFRFEVLQEKIDYLQNMLVCPVCKGAYGWRKSFLNHLDSVHKLKDLVSHLSKACDEKVLPTKLKVSRSFFRNLLPDAPDFDLDASNSKPTVNDSANDKTDGAAHAENSTCQEFACEVCNYQAADVDELKEHSLCHDCPDDDYSPGMFGDGMDFSERFPPADLSQYVIKKGTPTTFSCDMCPFECVKTAHFRRHLEVHKRNESLTEGYKCGYCKFMHNRLNCIRFHLGKYHGGKPYLMTRIVDNKVITYGPEDDPTLAKSKARKRFTTSTPIPIVKPERERKVPAKYSSSLDRSSLLDVSTCDGDLQAILQFEKQLPSAMIYPEPLKCPKCDFSNRVRVNLLRHLKLHKEEKLLNSSMTDQSFKVEASARDGEEEEDQEEDHDRSSLNPLLSFLSNKKGSNCCDDDFLEGAEEVTFISRTDFTEEYKYFSIKLHNGSQYQCKECKFVHRYPSKVKRHYYYKHAPAFPFKCGYCTFGAVESGKVKRHCKLVHKHKREMVIKRNVYKKETQSDAFPSALKMEIKKERPASRGAVVEEDGVQITTEVVRSGDPESAGELWLPQFVTMLDDDMQCCKLCGYQQDGSSSLRDHVYSTHLEFYPFSCTYCGFALMDVFRVKKHIDMHHPNMPYVAVKRQTKVDAGAEDDAADESLRDMVIDESSQVDSNVEESFKRDADDEEEEEDGAGGQLGLSVGNSTRDVLDESDLNGSSKRQFKCHYCGVVSKWNRRDIRLHILHVHLKKKVYTCRHCGFGNSKSKAVVKSHCIKFHPSKNVSVRDELVLFNAIIPIDDSHSIVTMALSNKDGIPIMELPNDEEAEKAVKNLKSSSTKDSKTSKHANASNTSLTSVKSPNSYLKSDKWKCKECAYASNSEIDVKYHLISSHMNLKPYSCPHCHLYMNKTESVTSHIGRLHPGKHRGVVSTVEEKAAYLQKNMECLFSAGSDSANAANDDEDVIDANFARIMEQQTNPRYSSGYFRCLICGYRDPRNDKTKYHIIKTHLNLRQFSCPHCNLYMWGRQQVIIHIEEAHPGKEIFVKRTFQEYDDYLRKNIKRFPYPKMAAPAHQADVSVKITTKAIPRIYCDSCSFVTDSELSLAAHKRTHRIFQCFYCEFKHMLAARVQSHCLSKHQYKLVRFKQINSSNFETTKMTSGNSAGPNSDDESEVEFEKEDEPGEGVDSKTSRLENADGGTYVCQHCQVVKKSKHEITKHLKEIHHHSGTSAYTFIKARTDSSKGKTAANSSQDFGDEEEEDMDVDGTDPTLPIKMNNIQNTKFSNVSSQFGKSRASLYQCTLCTYKSNKMTVMRHHIMSHLRYHPYICPYCDVARSVKSFPIKKHVVAKHPGREVRSLHCINEDLEKKISKSYYKIKMSSLADDSAVHSHDNTMEDEDDGEEDVGNEAVDEEDSENEDFLPPSPPAVEAVKPSFKCKFCSFVTGIRTDMKHHLMKEINYKPLKCTVCSFAETQRPVLSKHFQVKHPGVEVAIREEGNSEKEELVRKMLEETIVEVKSEPKEVRQKKSSVDFTLSLKDALPSVTLSSMSHQKQQRQKQHKPMLSPVPVKAGSKILKCPECPYTNSSMKLVRGHMIKHGPYRFKCSYCDYMAHYPSRIRKHTKTQHQGLSFKFTKVVDEPNRPAPKPEVPSACGNSETASLDSTNAVYLDGVLVDLPFSADSDGWYRCQFCDYKSLDRDNFKVHVVTHRPPRWKCYHCSQKYHVVFRVRRHCIAKHPKLPIRWVDVETNKVFSNSRSSGCQMSKSLMLLTSAARANVAAKLHVTARKSMHTETGGYLVDPDLGISSKSSLPNWKPAQTLKFCCHLCDFVQLSRNGWGLFKHLKVEHFWSDKLPSIEILPTGDEGEVWALRRCGFCAFETYDSETFRSHVLRHTVRPPVQCAFCSFGSFSCSVVVQHARCKHEEEISNMLPPENEKAVGGSADAEDKETIVGDNDVLTRGGSNAEISDSKLYRALSDEYITSAQDEQHQDWSGNVEVLVNLVNVMPDYKGSG